MNPVVHFEMSYDDAQRMTRFYEKVFGWNTQQLGDDMGRYVLATTSETDDNGLPKNRGMINGGFYARGDAGVGPEPSVVISVADIHESLRKLHEAGGKALSDVMEIPGIGLYVAFNDTEGNRVGMLQPTQQM